MCVCSVQFHRQALSQSEWHVSAPSVRRVDSKNTVCEIVVRRDDYVVDIVGIVLVLTGLENEFDHPSRVYFRIQ